jgi:hypothetical protein
MTTPLSRWLVFTRPVVAGFHLAGDNQGRDSIPQNQCGHPDEGIGASASDILGIRDSRFSKIGSAALPKIGKGASLHAVLVFEGPQPNKAPEPTITSVTPPAGAGVAPAALVAHL